MARRWNTAAGLALAGHVGLAGGGWWLLPHGFAAGHARWWTNEVLPWVVTSACVAGLVALRRERPGGARVVLAGLVGAWLGAAAALMARFPESGGLPATAGLLGAALVAVVALGQRGGSRLALAAATVTGALLGVGAVLAQAAPAPSTRPRDEPVPLVGDGPDLASTVALGSGVRVATLSGRVSAACGGLDLEVDPSLTFGSCSPDGFWTIFAPRGALRPPPPRLVRGRRADGALALAYEGLGETALEAAARGDGVRLTAWTEVPRPVASHLNTFVRLRVTGGAAPLRVSFSPCPTPIDVTFSDYPAGRPARLACLDADGTFRVLEASSGEKGPFRELARGRLGRGEPLGITLHEGERPACRVVLEDWAAQASCAPSPTAGWGLPQNAIEFRLLDVEPHRAALWVTLSATSVGRGWDSVVHGPGVYRNRMRVEPPS